WNNICNCNIRNIFNNNNITEQKAQKTSWRGHRRRPTNDR
ncbi:26303_t:CDS:1, partial [Dentiscutata erythropus]